MDTIVVGIDVSKDRLDVAVRPAGTTLSCSRDAAGIEGLIGELGRLGAQLIAVEATGGFETVVVASLAAASLPVVVVNPAQVRAFARAIGQRAKTDPIDARVIAHFAEATKPQVRPLPDAATQGLADLVARRRQIIQMIVAEGQRAKRAAPRAKRSIGRLLEALRRELSEIDADIDESVRGSPLWCEKESLLTSVPVSVPAPRAPCWQSFPNSAASPAAKSPRWPAWLRSRASPASGAARASSAAAAPAYALPCSWRH
jgi:transposase